MLGGATDQYRRLYEKALATMKQNIFYRPMTVDGKDILLAGHVDSDGSTPVEKLTPRPEAQHLGCFAGGMVGLAAKIFQIEEDMKTAMRLVEGCLWGYEAMRQGILPEIIETLPCDHANICSWNESRWLVAMEAAHGVNGKKAATAKLRELGLPPGITSIKDKRYILR
jgi:mannosyl-oligosaccharide alpha-1,2-mannosidase